LKHGRRNNSIVKNFIKKKISKENIMAKKQTNPQKTSFEELLAEFKDYMNRDGKSKGTIENYTSHLTKINDGNKNNIITWL